MSFLTRNAGRFITKGRRRGRTTLPLEAILADDDTDTEDLLQISLFGDSTPIKEAESNIKDVTEK